MPCEPDQDRAAIIRRMETESRAFWEKDWEAWTSSWVHGAHAVRQGWWSLGGITQVVGWDAIRNKMRSRFDNNPEPNRSAHEFRMQNMSMRIGHDIAWVTYDMRAPDTGEPEMDMPGLTHETKILEKHDGEWLLAYVGYLHQSVRQVNHPLIEVDQSRRVLWKNEQAKIELENGHALRIVGDRLSGPIRADTERLNQMVGWAASLCDLIDVQSGAVPLVLDSYEDCEHQLCWVMAISGKIYVAINNQDITQQRLAAAAVIHGLTPAQVSLAREILAGCDLPSAAKQLGVSTATVRTQLQRIYDKVGVRTQPALVRVLLSSTAPTIQI